MRAIDVDALKEHKFVGNKFVQIGGRTNGKTLENINKAYQQGWNDCIDAIIDNAPTVEIRDNYDIGYAKGHIDGVLQGEKLYARPTGEWINDFRSDYEPFMQRGWKCTNCSKRTTYGKPAFCMYCGADMRGDKNEVN